MELKACDHTTLYIPPGFGHGFLALSEEVGFAYKVTDYYSAPAERTIRWNDPDLAIDWPVTEAQAIVSAKDQSGTLFTAAEVFD
jgi:dTDP-4-dehydrorhamnose 3,5-epimerase